MDLGCWDAATYVTYAPPSSQLFGVELDGTAAARATERGILVVQGDLSRPLPFSSGMFSM